MPFHPPAMGGQILIDEAHRAGGVLQSVVIPQDWVSPPMAAFAPVLLDPAYPVPDLPLAPSVDLPDENLRRVRCISHDLDRARAGGADQ